MPRIDILCKCCHMLFRRFCGSAMKKGMFIIGMRLCVTFLNMAPFYVVNFELIEYMPNRTDRWLYKVLFNFWLFMTLTAYWTACLRHPPKIPAIPRH